MTKQFHILALALCFMLASTADSVSAKSKKKSGKATVSTSTKKQSAYEKLFADKKYKTVAGGGLTLHTIGDKLYLELPRAMQNNGFMISTSIERTCDSGDGFVYQQPSAPYLIRFEKGASDSILYVREFAPVVITDDSQGMGKAIEKSNTDPIVSSYKIVAFTPDSSALVADITDLFMTDNRSVRPIDLKGGNAFDGWMTNSAKYKRDRSMVYDILAGAESISILSEMSYGMSVTLLGILPMWTDKPQSIIARRSIHPLSDPMMKLRLCDERIGVRAKPFLKFSDTEQKSSRDYYACRRNIFDENGAVKPIIFYIDTLFSDNCRAAVEKGILMWNDAFRRMGYDNVIQTRPIPAGSDFDSNSVYNSCVRHIGTSNSGIFTQSWIDPRSGEILGTNILVPFNYLSGIQSSLMLNQAAADPAARTFKPSDAQVSAALTAIIARRVSSALGLLPNYTASMAYPTDSLRSPSFTQANGITASITDDTYYNLVAQAGDKERGVKLVADALGPYDCLAIEWLYKPIANAKTPKEEAKVLSRILSEKSGDPRYLYLPFGNKQNDPRFGSNDMGRDIIKSVKYQFDNLKYIAANGGDWFGSDDPDYKQREYLFYDIVNRFNSLTAQVARNIGGIYTNPRCEGDAVVGYSTVPKEVQRESVLTLLDMISDMEWIDRQLVSQNVLNVVETRGYLQRRTSRMIIEKLEVLDFAASKSDDPYRVEDMYADLTENFAGKLRASRPMTEYEKYIQQLMLKNVIDKANVRIKESEKPAMGIVDNEPLMLRDPSFDTFALASTPEEVSYGYEAPRYVMPEINESIYLNLLEKLKSMYVREAGIATSADTRNFCRYMLDQIDRAMTIR